jgi:UDP-N-acetylmuramate--alanine ligase
MTMNRVLDGRRIYFIGIGGAGLSAYAVLSKAWGAEVAGWDRKETPYLAHVREAGIPVSISDEPAPPDGWEAVVSSAFSYPGRRRAEFLSELVTLCSSLVVAGAHGKTTTAGMIAFCLDRLGQDPAFLIGGDIPQLGGNAGTGSGWLIVEGDESDRTIESLRPEIAVVTNLDLDHHTTYSSRAELEEVFERWLEHVPTVVRGEELEPPDLELALPGEHNRRNAACALVALELLGVSREEAATALREFRGAARRFERRGEAGGVVVFDEYAHHPTEVAAALTAAREESEGRVLAVFQPHLYSRTRHFAREFAQALSVADAACITDVYAARESPIDGVSGKLVADALVEIRPGMPVGWTPAPDDAASFLARRAEPGEVVLTIGAGDVDRVGEQVLELLA